MKFYFATGFLGVCHHSESLDDMKSILTEICPEFGCMHDCGQGCNNWGFSHIIYQALSKPSDENGEKNKNKNWLKIAVVNKAGWDCEKYPHLSSALKSR